MSHLDVTAAELKLYEEFYRRRLAEAGQVRDDTEELAVARDILQAVVNEGLTPTADGGASYVRRGARDWSDPATVQAAQATLAAGSEAGGRKSGQKKQGRVAAAGVPAGGPGRSKEMLQGLGMLAAVLAIAGWFFWPMLFSQADETREKGKNSTPDSSTTAPAAGEPSSAQDGTAGQQTPVPTLQTDMLADIIDAGGVKTGPVAPRTLEIRGVSYIIQPVQTLAGDWPRPETERAVSWVYGSVVNYVLGLEATPENKALLASLSPGEEILLRLSTGPTYRFAYADAVRVSPQASEIFTQTRPGLVLVLLGDQDQAVRVVIRAVYLPGPEGNEGEAAPVEVVGLAETVSVGDNLGLTCLGYEPLAPAGTPPGYVYLEVHFVVENRLNEAVATTTFAHHLKVGELAYPAVTQPARAYSASHPDEDSASPSLAVADEDSASPSLAVAGKDSRLPALLAKGQVLTTTAVYAVPEAALKEEIAWEFAPDPAGEIIRIVLPPYEGALDPAVTVQTIEMKDNVLAITFDVQAPGLHALELAPIDLQLEGGTLAPTGNIFPWRLGAGEWGKFTLLVLPQTSPVTVGLLQHGFEITWKGGGE